MFKGVIDKIKNNKDVICIIAKMQKSLSLSGDLIVVHKSKTATKSSYYICEEENKIKVNLIAYNEFIRKLNEISFANKGIGYEVVYCKDESLSEILERKLEINDGYKRELFLELGVECIYLLDKIKELLSVDSNINLTLSSTLELFKTMAAIEVTMNNKVLSKNNIIEAINLNKEVFGELKEGFIKDLRDIQECIEVAELYIDKNAEQLFNVIIKYVRDNEVTSVGEIDEHINKFYHIHEDSLYLTCKWLSDRNILIETFKDIKLWSKDKEYFQEVAYAYNWGK